VRGSTMHTPPPFLHGFGKTRYVSCPPAPELGPGHIQRCACGQSMHLIVLLLALYIRVGLGITLNETRARHAAHAVRRRRPRCYSH